MDIDEIARLNIIQLMQEAGLTQAELVRRIVRRGHVFDTASMNRVFHGVLSARGHLEKFADGLAVPVDRLLKRITPSVDAAPGPSEGDANGGADVTAMEQRGQVPAVDDCGPVAQSAPHARVEA
jgi:hypothetical protein